jgi:hypothetical protein
MKKLIFLILLLISSSIYGQNRDLEFLKSSIHAGEPTIDETINWLNKSLICWGGYVLIDNQGGSRETEYPCFVVSDSSFQKLNLKYSHERNEISFTVDNMGCYAGAYDLESAEIVIFLDNLSSNFNLDQKRIEFISWNSAEKRSNNSEGVLGYVKYDNYNDCSGVSLRSFCTLSLDVNLSNRDQKVQFKLALDYLQAQSSAQQKKCRDY